MKSVYSWRILGFVLAYLPVLLAAQDWAPIRFSDKTYAYQQDPAEEKYLFVRVEEAGILGGDSLYILNTIITACDSCNSREFFLRNQPHFLQKRVRFTASGSYHFQDTGSFVIQSLAGVGESWVFDTLGNVTATVLMIGEQAILGETDSVKTIGLSSGKQFLLSKTHGLLQFPDANREDNFHLKGLQGKKRGLPMPTYQDFFEYEIGDRFEIRAIFREPYVGYTDSVMQIEIVDKEVQEDRLSYQVKGIGRSVSVYTYICCDTTDVSFFDINKRLTYVNEPDHPLNHVYTRYPSSAIRGFGPEPSPVIMQPYFYFSGGLSGGVVIGWRNLLLAIHDSSDVVESLWTDAYDLEQDHPQTIYATSRYESGVGLVSLEQGWNSYEYGHTRRIVAMKQGDQIFGEFTPNALAISSPTQVPGGGQIPSDSSDCETYSIIHQQEAGSGTVGKVEVLFAKDAIRSFELVGLDGRNYMRKTLSRNYHNIGLPPELVSGIYIVKVHLVDECIVTRKILIR